MDTSDETNVGDALTLKMNDDKILFTENADGEKKRKQLVNVLKTL